MPDPAWPSSPPEVNYLRLIGPGAAGTATTLASGAAWQALMAGNEVAFSVSTLNTAVTAVDFTGVGGASSTTAVTGLNSALQLLAGWAQEKPPIAASAVAAYETAVSAMIPAAIATANRAEQAADVALNPLVLGALTPAIVALDTAYFGEFWPQNAGSGAAYGAALTALVAALAVPPPMSPPGAAAAAPATAASAVAQAAGQVAAGEAMKESAQLASSTGGGVAAPAEAVGQLGQMTSMLGQPVQAAMGALQPVTGMFQAPMQAVQSLAALPQSMAGGLAGAFGVDGLGVGQVPAALPGGSAAAPIAGGAGVAAGGIGPVGSASVGGSTMGSGGVPGAGLTSYSKPPSAFSPENAGRPTGLKTGLLSAADLKGLANGGLGGGAVPMSPAHGGAHGQPKGESGKDDVVHARIVTAGGERTEESA